MIGIGRFITFMVVLGIIVLVHEFGHYIAARWMKVRVEVFSFGFGKRLFGRRVGPTDFRFSLVPLGGYVRLGGQEEYDPAALKDDDFMAKNRGQRLLVMAMGSLMNLFFAFMVLTVISMNGIEMEAYRFSEPLIGFVEPDSPADLAGLQPGDLVLQVAGRPVRNWKEMEIDFASRPREEVRVKFQRAGEELETTLAISAVGRHQIGYSGLYWPLQTVISQVAAGYPAAEAGLQPGDLVTAIDGQELDSYFHFREIVQRSSGEKLLFSVERNGRSLELTVVPREADNYGIIGVNVDIPSARVSLGPFAALGHAWRESQRLISLTFNAFRNMIRGTVSPQTLSGPIEIAKFSHQALQSGLSNFFMLIAFISLQLGFVNLLPIPMLDGGQMLTLAVEALIRRDLPDRLKSLIQTVGLVFLLSLMAFVIFNDIAKTLPKGWRSLLFFLN